jgi:hypothetical protein
MNDILIVEIYSALVLYEKIEYEIFGNEFLYCSKGLFDDFTQLPQADKKIAVLGANYVSHSFDVAHVPAVDLSMFDLLIIFDQELLPGDTPEEYLELTRARFSIDNVVIVTGAIKQNITLTIDKIFVFPLFLIEVSYSNTYTENTTTKSKLFDALLGIEKPHRAKIFEKLCTTNLLDKSYVSLINNDYKGNISTIYYSPELQQLEQAEAVRAKELNSGVFNSYEYTLSHPRLPHIRYPVSRQIPSSIYQNSYYSIVAETNWNQYVFSTEKTVKPLFARRLFVMFSAQHHLKQLQEYGFKTFSSVIDESYDNEVDDELRWDMAFDQIIALSNMDPIWVQEKIKDILEHNYTLINDRARLIAPIRDWLLPHIKAS